MKKKIAITIFILLVLMIAAISANSKQIIIADANSRIVIDPNYPNQIDALSHIYEAIIKYIEINKNRLQQDKENWQTIRDEILFLDCMFNYENCEKM